MAVGQVIEQNSKGDFIGMSISGGRSTTLKRSSMIGRTNVIYRNQWAFQVATIFSLQRSRRG